MQVFSMHMIRIVTARLGIMLENDNHGRFRLVGDDIDIPKSAKALRQWQYRPRFRRLMSRFIMLPAIQAKLQLLGRMTHGKREIIESQVTEVE